MADLNINPKFIDTLQRTAGAMVAQKVAQQFSTKGVLDIQRVLQAGDFLQGALGSRGVDTLPQPLLGGVTLAKARETYKQLSDARMARKNLFYIQVTDENPPDLSLKPRPPAAPAQPGSPLSQAFDALREATGGGLGGIVASAMGGPPKAASGNTPNLAYLFNLFATNVNYGPNTMTGERVHFGAVSMDKLMGTEPTEMQITTMDDEVGTLKRWFQGKFAQAAHGDGTFGLPKEYCVNIEVYHAVPEFDERAYAFKALMRPQSITHELSRSDQAMQEIQMTFSQSDSFNAP